MSADLGVIVCAIHAHRSGRVSADALLGPEIAAALNAKRRPRRAALDERRAADQWSPLDLQEQQEIRASPTRRSRS